MTTKRVLTFVTGNPNKLEEVKAIIGDLVNWELISKDLDLPELQGEPEDIVTGKCKIAVEKVNGPVIVEDTCLCFNALNGLPGPYIKWFLKKLGHEGLNKMLYAYDDKTAYSLCTFGYSDAPGQPVKIFRGTNDGTVVPARGPHNFGWDPIFQPNGFDKTYAELPSSVKNTISHRFNALDQLKTYLSTVSDDNEGSQPPEAKKMKEN